MTQDSSPKPSGRLLSKVVKFITSPTTDWADLNRVEGAAEPSESSLALKEMIERKRRNDFVRNREFDMLRKARRRQLTGAVDAAGVNSFVSSVESAHPHERERTLEKIDEIEQEMSRVWLDRTATESAESAESTQATTAPAHAYDPTRPSGLEGGPGAQPAAGFVPTAAQSRVPPLYAGDTEGAALGEADAPPPFVPAHEVVATQPEAPVSPEIEEVAIRFANGDTAGAEASLLELLAEGGSHEEDLEAWLTLFDLYRAAVEPDKFDGAAIAFAGRFGRSAPQWELVSHPGSGAMPMVSLPAAAAGRPAAGVHWSAPAVIGTQSIATLNAVLARQAPPWRLDWRRVRTIEPAALPGLIDTLTRWAAAPVGLRFHGAEDLLRVLAEQSPTDRKDVDSQWWAARLALLRVMHELDEFELVALNYCVTYEMSPPSWETPQCDFAEMAESGHTLPPPDDDGADLPSIPPATDLVGITMPTATDAARLDLEGVILNDAAAALAPLQLTDQTRNIDLNCRHLQRVDFGAAGTLLNWSVEQQGRGRQVVFRHVNRLVAAFFGVIGIPESARVLRRVD